MDIYESFRLSALSKSKFINKYVKGTTIGSNKSVVKAEEKKAEEPKVEEQKALIHLEHNYASNVQSVVQNILFELENVRQGQVEEAVNSRIKNMVDFTKQQNIITHQQILRRQQLLENETHETEVRILQTLEQYDKDTLEQHQQLQQYYQILDEKHKQNTKELEEQEKRRKKMCVMVDLIKQNQTQFCSIYQKIVRDIKSCPFQSQLREHLGGFTPQLKALPDCMEEIIASCKSTTMTENDCVKSNRLLDDIKGLQAAVEEKISMINKEAEVAALQAQPPSVTTVENKSQIGQVAPQSKIAVTDIKVDQFASESSLKTYTELQQFVENYTLLYKDLAYNNNFKKFRFDCKKAVNIPVSAISSTNPHHLLDKYNRLSDLLSGKQVPIPGDVMCAANHPQGIPFCTNLLAKRLVLQADLNISSNPNSAYCYASIIIALWNNHPEFGKLLLAEFHKQCPYLVPMFLPRTVEQTDQQFYESQGYQYVDGVVENQDKFLKRMVGMITLYSAIIVAKPRRGQTNPVGLVEGWRWLTSFINLQPKLDVTATFLCTFLEVCGFALHKAYGKVFERLMEYICGFYFQKIKNLHSGGPVDRLQSLLVDYYKTKRFEEPKEGLRLL